MTKKNNPDNTEILKANEEVKESTNKIKVSLSELVSSVDVFNVMDKSIQAVKSSMNDAVASFDMMSKFSTSIGALGYSTKEVDASMSKLKKGVSDIPTTLDDMASSTQQFTIATGDLGKGTDAAIALNNAFLAGSSSTDQAKQGMDNYLKMLSSGEVDLASWQELQSAMGPSMDKVAQSFKDQGVNSVSELYDALKRGDITFAEFNDHLIGLNDGVGGFASEAKKNTKGINNSFEGIHKALTGGLTDAIKAVDDAMQKQGFGSISDNLDKVKENINHFFEFVNEHIPQIVELFGKINKVITPLLPLLAGLAGAFIAVGATNSAITLVSAALGMLAANPIMAIVGAVIAFVAAIIYLWKTNEDFRNFWIGVWESIKTTFTEVIDWIVEKWNSVIEFFKGLIEIFAGIWESFGQLVADFIAGFLEKWNTVKEFFSSLIEFFAGVWQAILEKGSEIVDQLGEKWNSLMEFFSNLWQNIKETAFNSWDAFKEGLSNTWNTIKETAMNIWNSIFQSLSEIWNRIASFASELWTGMCETVGNIWGSMKEIAVNLATALVDGVSKAWDSMKQWTSEKMELVKDSIKSIGDINLLEVGKDIVRGLIRGLGSMIEFVKEKANEIAGVIPKSIKKVLNIGSPSKVMAQIGVWTGEGLANGIDSMESSVSNSLANLVDTDIAKQQLESLNASLNQTASEFTSNIDLNQTKQPLSLNLKLGNQNFKAFVNDISSQMALDIDLTNQL